ncbi:MAG: hypothetical protein ACSHXD_09480 [Marinosulfonomonas sp.]
MTFFWIVFAILAVYVLHGFIAEHPHRRVFAEGLPDDEIVGGYLSPREVADPDEDDIAKRVSAAFSAQTKRHRQNAGRDDPDFHEPHWGHTNGIVHGSLSIDGIENLPEAFRVGLFARDRTYPVVARSGMAVDRDIGFAINRLALKLKYPDPVPNVYASDGTANELDLLFVAGTSETNALDHTFFVRDGRQMNAAAGLKPASLETLKTLANWRNVALLLEIRGRVKKLIAPYRRQPESSKGWAGKPYYSLGPFALGAGAMKFRLIPVTRHDVAEHDPMKRDVTSVYKNNMDAWMKAGEDATFRLGVQLATQDCIPSPKAGDPPKAVMAAEYCDIQWDETVSPYIDVGTLTLKADASLNTAEMWGKLQFNAWNTLSSMRPLGQLFRLRKHAHAAHSNTRVAHIYGNAPGEIVGKCPFQG